MGPKKIAPVAGQMTMTSFFMRPSAAPVAGGAHSTPAVKKTELSSSGNYNPVLESGSTDRDESTPSIREETTVKAMPLEPTPSVDSTKKAEGGQVEPAVSANSKPVKRRLDEFVNDEESDNDRDVVLEKSKAATLISTKGKADRKMKEKVKKPRLSSGNKSKSKEKTGRRKMIIASDDEEETWDEDAEAEEEESSSGEDSGDAYTEESDLEDSDEEESLVDSDDEDDVSESEEESVKRKPSKSRSKATTVKTPASKTTALDTFSARKGTPHLPPFPPTKQAMGPPVRKQSPYISKRGCSMMESTSMILGTG